MGSLLRGSVRFLLVGTAGIAMLFSLSQAGAASANLSKSYNSKGPIPNGSLVSLSKQKAGQVEAANSDNSSRLIGVILPSSDSLLAINPEAGKVQVAINGSVDALVSNLGGSIANGDEIGVSPFSGIGMKAAAGSRTIGLAQTAFSKDTPGAVKQTVTDKSGNQSQISVGFVRITLGIATDTTPDKNSRSNGLQRFVQGYTGHSVSNTRVILSLLIAVIALLLLITLIYAAIYGSIISIGRNPLAKYAVFRTLGSVVAIAILTAVFAAISIYFLLR